MGTQQVDIHESASGRTWAVWPGLRINGLCLALLAVALIWLSAAADAAGFRACPLADFDSAAASVSTGCGSRISVSATARLAPSTLPATTAVPASMRIGFTSKADDGTAPELSRIEFDISRNVELHTVGLPSCSFAELYSDVASPGHSCAKSFIGRGIVNSEIALTGEEPVDVKGHLSAFYVLRKEGRFILARVRTGEPLPLIYVIPFKIVKGQGAFGTSLVVRRMQDIVGICARPGCFSPYTLKGIYSHISKLEFSLHRRFRTSSTRDSLLNARCPAESKAFRSLAAVSLTYGSPYATSVVVGDNCQPERRNHSHR